VGQEKTLECPGSCWDFQILYSCFYDTQLCKCFLSLNQYHLQNPPILTLPSHFPHEVKPSGPRNNNTWSHRQIPDALLGTSFLQQVFIKTTSMDSWRRVWQIFVRSGSTVWWSPRTLRPSWAYQVLSGMEPWHCLESWFGSKGPDPRWCRVWQPLTDWVVIVGAAPPGSWLRRPFEACQPGVQVKKARWTVQRCCQLSHKWVLFYPASTP